MGMDPVPLRLVFHLGLFAAAVALPVTGRAEIYCPCLELMFSPELEVVEVGETEAFNANPDGGTPRTLGQSNLAWAGNGATAFESSRISETYGDDKLINGVYGVGHENDTDDATRPWIAADEDTSAFAGVKFGAACAIGAIGFGSRFRTRSDGVFTLQVTADDFTGVDLKNPSQVAAASWITVGSLTSTTEADAFGRHLVAFEKVAGVTAVRILVSQGGTTITEIEAYKDITAPPDHDPPAAPTAYTHAVLSDGPIHYYRFEETHLLQPAKDAVGSPPCGGQPGTFQGDLVAGEPSAHAGLGMAVSFGGSPGSLVNLGAPFHPGPSVSVEAWVSLDPSVSVDYAPIAARWDGSYELDVNVLSGKANFVTKNNAGTFALAEGLDSFSAGVWHHVAGVFDQGKTVVYVDGVPGTPVDTSGTGLDLQGLGDTLFIGSTRDGIQFTWKGLIDEVAFYDYALSQEQIAGHIAAARGCVEEPDLVWISGTHVARMGESVALAATLDGIDPGGAAVFSWEVVAGSAVVDPTDAPLVTVSSSEAGAVTVRVSAADGVCDNLVTAEHDITFADPRAAPTPYTAAVVADGPIHYYRFEEMTRHEPARDAVGPGPDGDHPGTFQGSLTLGEPSAFESLGQALSFDGTPGTLVNLGTPFHPGPSVSVEAWVNLDPAASALFSPIAARWDGSYELDCNASKSPHRINFVTRNAGEEYALAQSAEPLTKGVWHHVVGVFDKGITTVYVDGVQGEVIDHSGTGEDLRDEASTLFIGSTRDGSVHNWHGLLDEVAFYDHALPPERIAAHLAAASMPFHRGDANGDGYLDISDGIFVFEYLFLGGRKPECMESANANDGEKLDLSDGIYVLNFLFLGGTPMPAPGAPGSPCGYDPPESRTNLGCKVYNHCE